MPLPAASGYPQYSQSLIDPLFSTQFLLRSYANSILTDITTTKYNGKLDSYGDTIVFKREPVTRIHRYHKNIKLNTDTPEIETLKLTIDDGFYWNYKLDRVDIKQIQHINELQNSIMNSGVRAVNDEQEKAVFARMVLDASPQNKGVNSGAVSRNINLGAVGSPLLVNGDNFNAFMSRLSQTLQEQNSWVQGEMFVILPPAAQTSFATSSLSSAWYTGMSSPVVGKNAGPDAMRKLYPFGFDIQFSNFVPQVVDPTANAQCSFVIFGRRLATGFCQQLSETDVMKAQAFFGSYFRGLNVFGHKPLLSEQIGVAYVRFD